MKTNPNKKLLGKRFLHEKLLDSKSDKIFVMYMRREKMSVVLLISVYFDRNYNMNDQYSPSSTIADCMQFVFFWSVYSAIYWS